MATAKDISKGKTINGKVIVKASSDGVKPAAKKAESRPAQKKQETRHIEQKPEQKNSGIKNVKFDRKELEPVLSILKDFIEKKAAIPALTHVHMKTGKEGIMFTATDLDKSWSRFIPGKGDTVNVCIPLDIFIREVKALHSDIKEVELQFTDNTVKVNGRCEIFVLSGDDFPVLPERGERQIDIPGFTDKVSRVLPAAGESDTYPKYENVIPQDNPIKVTFQGPDFLKVLEGALPVVADKGNAIRMTVNGKINIETNNPGIGNYKWHVSCSADGTVKNFTVGFNAKIPYRRHQGIYE